MNEQEYKAYDDYHDLRGNGDIVIYKRRQHKHPRWNVRVKVHGQVGYVTKSCTTMDFEAAKRFSEDLYYELEGRSRRGESINGLLSVDRTRIAVRLPMVSGYDSGRWSRL